MTRARRHLLLVAMNYAPEPSGTAPYTSALAAHLATQHDVTALVGVPHYPQWRIAQGYGAWRSEEEIDGVHLVRLRHHVPANTGTVNRMLHETTFAARAITQRTPAVDAVVAVTPPLFGLTAARTLAARHDVPWGVVVQDLYSAGTKELGVGGPAARASTVIESRLLRSASQVSVIHDLFRDAVVRDLAVPAPRVTVIPNWTHAEPAGESRAAVRSRMRWGSETVALHAGNMGSKQGLETIVAAAHQVDQDKSPVRFVLMGDGNQRPRLEELASRVRCIDFVDSVRDDEYGDVLAAADVLVVNEKSGVAAMSVPSKLTSYLAAGRPVLGSCDPDGATADIINRSGGGVIVRAGHAAEMVAGVLRLRDDEALAESLATSGKSWARRNLAARPALERYSAWVDELLARRH